MKFSEASTLNAAAGTAAGVVAVAAAAALSDAAFTATTDSAAAAVGAGGDGEAVLAQGSGTTDSCTRVSCCFSREISAACERSNDCKRDSDAAGLCRWRARKTRYAAKDKTRPKMARRGPPRMVQ